MPSLRHSSRKFLHRGGWAGRLGSALLVLALIQATPRLVRGLPGDDVVEPEIGEHFGQLVRPWQGGEAAEISSIEQGYCRYVVVYSTTCAAARGTAAQWQRFARTEPVRLPDDWKILWVSLDPLSDADVLADTDFPWATYEFETPGRTGLTTTPSHLLLDREGRVLEVAPGAALWKAERYAPDCTIRTEP